MLNLFKNQHGKSDELRSVHRNGAIVVDVRTPGEFASGHIENAVNIPVDTLHTRIAELKKKGKPVIACCRSGARSAMAVNILSQAGVEAYNGGSWPTLEKAIR